MRMKKMNNVAGNCKESAVSPIIAVILMVAITVMLAGAIYAWVNIFGSSDAGTNVVFTMDQTGHGGNGSVGWVNYTVNAVSGYPGYEDMDVSVGGYPATIMATWPSNMGEITNATGQISPGDQVHIFTTHCTASQLPGLTVNIRHTSSNTMIFSSTIDYS